MPENLTLALISQQFCFAQKCLLKDIKVSNICVFFFESWLVDFTNAEEIRWALEQLGLWFTGEIKMTKEPWGLQSGKARHCSVFLSVVEEEVPQYLRALDGQVVRGISAPGDLRGFMGVFDGNNCKSTTSFSWGDTVPFRFGSIVIKYLDIHINTYIYNVGFRIYTHK